MLEKHIRYAYFSRIDKRDYAKIPKKDLVISKLIREASLLVDEFKKILDFTVRELPRLLGRTLLFPFAPVILSFMSKQELEECVAHTKLFEEDEFQSREYFKQITLYNIDCDIFKHSTPCEVGEGIYNPSKIHEDDHKS